MKWLQSQVLSSRFFVSFAVFATVLLVCPPTPSSAQPQVGSAENPRDCKGVDFGQNVRDTAGGCCLPSQIDCGRCFYSRSECERQFGCFTTVRNLGCGCGNAAPVCGKCGYTMTECQRLLGCGTTATNKGCGCGKPAAGPCGCDLTKKNLGCGCGQQGPICGRCGGQYTACGDCSTTCCQNAFPPNIAPGIKCAAFRGWGGCKDCAGTNKGFYSNGWNGYVDTKYGSCVGSNASGQFLCGSMRCTSGAACPAGNIGCFDPGTQILLEGGKLEPASDIRVGDRLYNPLSGRSFAVKRILVGPEEIPMVELGFDGHLLKVTQDHPVLTRDGMKRANTVRIGEVIVDASGNEKVLHYVRLAEIIPGQKALNFELDVDSQDPIDRLIVSDNITSGDLAVQNSELPGEE